MMLFKILFVILQREKKQVTILKRAATENSGVRTMLKKGTEEYKKAQGIAGILESCGLNRNFYDNKDWFFDQVIRDVKNLDCFAAEVAKTIYKGMEKYRYPRVSSKQAWILACACVENGFDY